MGSGMRLCADGKWRKKFKTTRRNREVLFTRLRGRLVSTPLDAVTLIGRPCFYCGEEATTRDHLHPKSRGGKGAANKVPACFPCNQDKGARTLEEYRAWVAKCIKKSVEEVLFFAEQAARQPLYKGVIRDAGPGREDRWGRI